MMKAPGHKPVMPSEVLDYLAPRSGGLYLDGTLGGGGHARLVLEASEPDGRLIGLDRDPETLAGTRKTLAAWAGRTVLWQRNFSAAAEVMAELNLDRLDGALLDLGVSSFQLDTPERGFSFRFDGPLDMRMDPSQGSPAAELVNGLPVEELAHIFKAYGEERWAGRIARKIVREREAGPLLTTKELADLIAAVVPFSRDRERIHPATRVFQALRIAVNDELGHVERGVRGLVDLLKPGGRLVVISFHSLEDRLVKGIFREAATGCICPPRLPVCQCHRQPSARLLTRKAVRAGADEVAENSRSRSAVLRALERVQGD